MKHARDNKKDIPKKKRTVSEKPHNTARKAATAAPVRESAPVEKKVKKKANPLAGLRTFIAILLCIGIVIVLGIGSGMYAAISKEIDAMDFDSVAYNFSSTIYANDSEGNSFEVAHLRSEGNREWIDSDKSLSFLQMILNF